MRCEGLHAEEHADLVDFDQVAIALERGVGDRGLVHALRSISRDLAALAAERDGKE